MPRQGFSPGTYWLQDRRSTNWAKSEKHWSREFQEKTTPSRIFMPGILSSCRVWRKIYKVYHNVISKPLFVLSLSVSTSLYNKPMDYGIYTYITQYAVVNKFHSTSILSALLILVLTIVKWLSLHIFILGVKVWEQDDNYWYYQEIGWQYKPANRRWS